VHVGYDVLGLAHPLVLAHVLAIADVLGSVFAHHFAELGQRI
jgi:hypothetical protein